MTPSVYACEMLVDPKIKMPGEGFEEAWLQYHDGTIDLNACNVYMLVDPGFGKKEKGSKCSIQIIALTAKHEYYWIDGIAAPMNIIHRADWTFRFHRQYHPMKVGYEHYGLQGDVDYIKERMVEEGYHFEIMPLSANKGMSKMERIPWLIPIFKAKKFFVPRHIPKRKINETELDVVEYFVKREFGKWPATKEMDVLDSISWIKYDQFNAQFPEGYADKSISRRQIDFSEDGEGGSWMSM